jgi:acyl-[acyl-carrier-protein]-phospholipid O-acyltransferase/long-chain-fatty-acid--[acyl-carrier-protein] ligase
MPDALDLALAALGALAAFLFLTWLFPALLRPVFWCFAHLLFSFRAYNRTRVPRTGGVLIVANHTSFVDWLVLWVALPRRARFVLWDRYYRNPLLRFFLSWARTRTIRIGSGPHAAGRSLKQISDALSAGEVVVMFPEGELTRSGQMYPFGRGVERALAAATGTVTVVPTAISGLWNGFFSHGGGPALQKLPRAFRPRVCVWFGEALKPTFPPAADLRLAVQEATADLAIAESDRILPVHRRFVRNAAKVRRLFRTAVIEYAGGPPRALTFAKMLVGALCVTRYQRARLGAEPNVGIWLPTGLGSALANLALAFLGRASVNLNYTAGTANVRSALKQAGVRTVITAKRFTARMPLEVPDDVTVIYLEDVLASVTKGQRIRTFLMVALLPGWFIERFVLGLHKHKPDDVLTIVFSSGSTGEPKGVVLTHRNVATNTDSTIRSVEIDSGERLFGFLPFFHSFGYTICLWAPLYAPCVAVWYPDPRAAKEVGDIARETKASIIAGTATFLRFYIRRCGADDFRTLRLIICGAEKLPVKLQDEFFAKFGVLPLEGWGCTELSPVATVNVPDVTRGGAEQQRNCRGSVGQPLFGVVVRAHDPETGAPLPAGAEGVLWVKGPNVMAGYLNQPEKTAAAVKNGWYNTGDAGLVQEDGFPRITGRLSRFAKIAGEMVPLEKLDDEMHDYLATGGERVLAVAAVPDEKRGERVVVLYLPQIESRLGELLAALPKRGIPNLWVPDRRDCHPIDTMPVLGTGKLDLKKLSDTAREIAGR